MEFYVNYFGIGTQDSSFIETIRDLVTEYNKSGTKKLKYEPYPPESGNWAIQGEDFHMYVLYEDGDEVSYNKGSLEEVLVENVLDAMQDYLASVGITDSVRDEEED